MARDIREFLNSSYVKCSNNLRKREVIQVYVEDEIDKVFWYVYLHPYEELYNCTFRISTLQDRNKILKGNKVDKKEDSKNRTLELLVDNEYEVKDDLTEYINKFIKVGNQYKSKFFKNVWYMLSGNSEKLGLLKQNFLPDDNNNSKTPDKLNYFDWYENKSGNVKNRVKVNEDGELLLNDEKTNLSELVIQQFICKEKNCPVKLTNSLHIEVTE